jgi:hypothetical protein
VNESFTAVFVEVSINSSNCFVNSPCSVVENISEFCNRRVINTGGKYLFTITCRSFKYSVISERHVSVSGSFKESFIVKKVYDFSVHVLLNFCFA